MKSWIFLLVFLLCIASVSATTYTVSTCNGLQNISLDYAGTYNLANDIDCSGFSWTILDSSFGGIVDGKNFTIKNLYYNNSATGTVAFLTNPGTCTVKNICFDNLTMIGDSISGGVFGYPNGANTQGTQICVKNSWIEATKTSSTTNFVGAIFGQSEAQTNYDITDCYVTNTTLKSDASSSATNYIGAIVGSNGYKGSIFRCYSFNNTIIVNPGIGTDGAGGFAGRDYTNYAGNITLSYARANKLINGTTNEVKLQAFTGITAGQHYSDYYGNSTGYTDAVATGIYDYLLNDSSVAPLSSWDFTNVWKLGQINPIFLWQTEGTPPAPDTTAPTYTQFSGNVTSIYVNHGFKVLANWTDDFALSSNYIVSWWNTTHWQNSSAPYGIFCGGANCSGISLLADVVGTWKGKFFSNDTSDNWNETGEFNVTVNPAPAPQWYYSYQNTTILQMGSGAIMSSNWTDTMNLSFAIYSTYNTTHWINSTPEDFSTCSVFYTNCRTTELSIPTKSGIWKYKWYVNNSLNIWNVSQEINITAIDTINPSYTTFYGTATSFINSGIVTISGNWTDNYKLSNFIASWWNTTHWQNATPYALPDALACGANCSTMTITTDRIGDWQFKFYATDVAGNQNVTGLWNLTVVQDVIPQWYNYSRNPSIVDYLGSISLKGNYTDDIGLSNLVIQVKTPSGAISFNGSVAKVCKTVANLDCQGALTASLLTAGVWQYKVDANDTLNQWNTTGWQSFTVLPDSQAPTYSNFYGNSTNISIGNTVRIVANWTDNYELYPYYILSYWNTTGWTNLTAKPFNETCGVNCSKATATPDILGIWIIKFYANDSSNNWNVTEGWNITVNPQPNRANITYWEITPCLSGAWQLGEPVNLSVIATVNYPYPPTGDKITITALINSTGNATYSSDYGSGTKNSGSRWNLSWDALPYLDSYQLIIYSNSANATVETEYLDISVSDYGLLNGECYVNSTVTPTAPSTPVSDMFSNLINAINIPLTIFWVIIMLIVIIVIWWYFHGEALLATLGSFGISLIWTFLGLKIGVLSGGIFTLIMIIIVGAGAFTIWIAVKRNG